MSSLTGSKSVKKYPFSSWSQSELICVRNAIKGAWNNVTANKSNKLLTSSEEEITEKLEYEIQRLMDKEIIQGFSPSLFQTIVRGAKFRSYNDAHLEKQPDLTLRQIGLRPGLVDDSRHEALFIECKVIDSGKTPLMYIENGIRRFTDGEYAWAMPHATMLAFVKNTATIPNSLEESFGRNKSKAIIKRCSPLKNEYTEATGSSVPKTLCTTHSRNWSHPKYGPPGDIRLEHIWLSCN